MFLVLYCKIQYRQLTLLHTSYIILRCRKLSSVHIPKMQVRLRLRLAVLLSKNVLDFTSTVNRFVYRLITGLR